MLHDEHPGEMFNNHLAGDKHKRALTLRQNTLTMLKKGNIKAQITTAARNSAIETRKRNQRVLKKCFSTVYLMAKTNFRM